MNTKCNVSTIDKTSEEGSVEALAALSSGIAHDLNNLFGIILGNAELALSEYSDREGSEHCLKDILNAALQGRAYIDSLSPLENTPSELVLGSLIKGTVQHLQHQHAYSLPLRYRIQPNLPPVVACYREIFTVLVALFRSAGQGAKNGTAIEIALSLEVETLKEMPIKLSLRAVPAIKKPKGDTSFKAELTEKALCELEKIIENVLPQNATVAAKTMEELAVVMFPAAGKSGILQSGS